MNSRVCELGLTVRADPARWSDLRSRAKAFATRVLVEADELLERRAPGRVVLIRTLDMKWRLREDAMQVDAEVTAFATEIAASLDTRARSAPRVPSPEDEVVVFEDEAAWRAAHLVANVRDSGQLPWFFERLEAEGEAPGVLVQAGNAPLAVAVVAKLAKDGVLAHVLNGLSLGMLERLADVLHGGRAQGARGEENAPLRASSGDGSRGKAPVGDGMGRARRRRAIAGIMAMAPVLLGRAEPPAERSPVESQRAEAGRPAGPDDGREGAPFAPSADIGDAVPTVEAVLSESARPSAEEPAILDGDIDIDPGLMASEWTTAYAGLFYLLNPVLELGIAELLWKACVNERAVLASVASLILGSDRAEDDAPRLFGGVPAPTRLPPIERDLQAEIAVGLLGAVIEALPRRALAELPPLTIGVAGERGRRVLVATPRGSSFLLYAMPAESPSEALDALDRFLARWPASAKKPHASPAIAELDARGRVVAERGAVCAPWMPRDLQDGFAPELFAQLVGVVAHVFAARCGADDVKTPDLLAGRYLRIPGRIVVDGEAMTVEIDMDHIDLDVRRAGLDRSPGWVPWLRRRTELVFVGGETE